MDTVREIAFQAAREAGQILVERMGNIEKIDYKSAFNIVTDVDKQSERKIVEILRAAFPNDDILAEEGTGSQSGQGRRWLVDPLDGTTNYTHSYPCFAVSIGLEEDGKVILGVVYNPVSRELFWAEKGSGAWLNDRKIAVSTNDTIGSSLLATGFPAGARSDQGSNLPEFAYITGVSHGVRRDGSAAIDLCQVACGRLDAFWERKLAPWDIAAGSLIAQEAGGRVTNLVGGPLDINNGLILASNGLIHQEVITALETVRQKRASLPNWE